MTDDELSAIDGRWQGVEWALREGGGVAWLVGKPVPYQPLCLDDDRAFLRLAAHAPADIQALVTEVRRLRAGREGGDVKPDIVDILLYCSCEAAE